MKTLAFALALACPLAGQDVKAFLGRWDFTVTPASGAPFPQWMELTEKDGKIEGKVQPRGGAWREIGGAVMQDKHLIVTVAPAGRGPATTWDLMLLNPDNTMIGTIHIDGHGGGPPPPGAPKEITNSAWTVTGGSGAFLGARGYWISTQDSTSPERQTSDCPVDGRSAPRRNFIPVRPFAGHFPRLYPAQNCSCLSDSPSQQPLRSEGESS